jgi:hypothetical protein
MSEEIKESTLHTDIADTDEILANIKVDAGIKSLAYEIADVQPLHGPTGAVFGINKKDGTNDFQLLRTDATVEALSPANISTGVSVEVIQDLKSQFGKDALKVMNSILTGVANEDENTKLLAWLDTNADDESGANDISIANKGNAEEILFAVIQKVGELVVKMNSKNFRTFDSWCVLPQTYAGTILNMSEYIDVTKDNENELFVGKIGKTKFFLNPDSTATAAYVGLKSKTSGKSSIIFSPYQKQFVKAIDPKSANVNLFLINRFAITLNALSVTDDEMIKKFEIS